jgi:hypothetical protein
VKNKDHVLEMLKNVEEKGGEGLMLRKPKSYVLSVIRRSDTDAKTSMYENKRSNTLQKIKVCPTILVITYPDLAVSPSTTPKRK